MTLLNLSGQPPDHSCPVAIGGKLGYWLNSKDADKLSEYVTNYKKAYFTPDEEEFKEIDRISRILDSTVSFSDVLEGMRPDSLKWNEGHPPYIGWWNASLPRLKKIIQNDSAPVFKKMWRWFDGLKWGGLCFEDDLPILVAAFASYKYADDKIEWRWHYPENARVKRIDSRTGKHCVITHMDE